MESWVQITEKKLLKELPSFSFKQSDLKIEENKLSFH